MNDMIRNFSYTYGRLFMDRENLVMKNFEKHYRKYRTNHSFNETSKIMLKFF